MPLPLAEMHAQPRSIQNNTNAVPPEMDITIVGLCLMRQLMVRNSISYLILTIQVQRGQSEGEEKA